MTLTALPFRHTKVIHLIRHGQGFHNVAGHKDAAQYLSYDWEDAHLTEYGWQQAEALHTHIANLPERLNVDLVVSSPLTRTLETAIGVFANEDWTSKSQGKTLMSEQKGVEARQVQRPAKSTAGCPPFIAHELCREHLGRHPCDKRRCTSHYRQQFPAVDFSLIETEEDELWGPDFREEKEQIKARGAKFMQWLMTRPEQRIAVVSHSSFLFFTMANFGLHASTTVQGELHRWYENCEMRTIVLSDNAGEGNLDPLWFPGGHQLQREGAAPPKEQYEPPENAEPEKHPEVAVPGEEPEIQPHQSENGTGQQHTMSNSRAMF